MDVDIEPESNKHSVLEFPVPISAFQFPSRVSMITDKADGGLCLLNGKER